MDGYGYSFVPPFAQMRGLDGEYPDHGDGFGEYYGLGPLGEDPAQRPSCSKYHSHKSHKRSQSRDNRDTATKSRSPSKSRSRSGSRSRTRKSWFRSGTRKSRSRSRTSKSRSQSRARKSRSRSRTRSRKSRSRSRSRSTFDSRHRESTLKEPGFLDAFRVMYLTPSKHKKSTTKYLATKKRQDRIQEILKSDGLGSKRWLFYPRPQVSPVAEAAGEVAGSRDNCDQRIKVDADFFRKYKRSKKVDNDAPIAKLKRWELILYKKLGFLQAV